MAKEQELGEIVSKRIELFKTRPEMAIYRPTVKSRHVKGLYTETIVRDHIVKADYARPAGGSNLAPNPIELLLSALAACIESAFYEFAAYEGLSIDALSVDVEGSLDLRGLFMIDDEVSAGFNEVKYIFTIQTKEDEKKIKDLAERVIAHCPVLDSLIRPVNIIGQIQVKKSSDGQNENK